MIKLPQLFANQNQYIAALADLCTLLYLRPYEFTIPLVLYTPSGAYKVALLIDQFTLAPIRWNKLFIVSVAASYGALTIGMLFGWSAPAGPRLVGGGEGIVRLNDDQFSWTVAFMPLGGTLIAIPCGFMLKSLGRKNTILFFVLPLLFGWISLTWAQVLAMMYVGRFLQGLAAGAYGMAVPIYIGEIANQRIRGTVGSFFQLMLNMGMLISFSVAAGVNVFQLNIISGFILLLFGPLFMFMPETPSFLIQQGKKMEAVESIKWLQGADCNALAEIELLEAEQDERTKLPQKTLRKSLLSTGTISALTAMIGMVTFLQLSGINAILFYATDIFMNASDSIDYTAATIIVGAMQVLGTILASFAVDRVGRRWLLIISTVIMCAAHITLGVYFHLLHDSPAQVENLEWLPVVALSAFVTMFSIGIGPVPWIMIGEIFAADVKDLASSLAVVTSNGLSFMMSKTFHPMREGLGEAGTFWLFAGFCFLAMIFVFIFVPETKGKTFDQIQKQLASKKVYCRTEKSYQE